VVVHGCNPSYKGGIGRRTALFRPALNKSIRTYPIMMIITTTSKEGWGHRSSGSVPA
jgi:hypothetical protein